MNQEARSSSSGSSNVMMVSNYRIGKKIGAGNFGTIHIGKNLYSSKYHFIP